MATARFFRRDFGISETTTGLSFGDLVDRFKIMIGPDNMRTRHQWWIRSRVWRRVTPAATRCYPLPSGLFSLHAPSLVLRFNQLLILGIEMRFEPALML